MKKNYTWSRLLVLGALFVGVTVQADSDEAAKDSKSDVTFSAGLTWTDGNSDTLRGNAAVLYEGEKERWGSVRAGVEGNYGYTRTDGERETDVENVRAYINARKPLAKHIYGALNFSFLHDGQADVDYRFILGPGLGITAFKNESTELTFEIGPSYVWEKEDGVTDDYLALRFAQRLDHRISETARVWQQVEYLPNAEKFSDYLLFSEIGISADLTQRLALRLVAQSAYNNKPAADTERHDLTVITGLSFTL